MGGSGVDTVSYEDSPEGVIVNFDEGKKYENIASVNDLESTFAINAAEAEDGFKNPNGSRSKDSFKFTTTKFTLQRPAGAKDDRLSNLIEETVNIAGELENLIGSENGDILIGNGADNNIRGLKGNDLFIGNAGGDTLDG